MKILLPLTIWLVSLAAYLSMYYGRTPVYYLTIEPQDISEV